MFAAGVLDRRDARPAAQLGSGGLGEAAHLAVELRGMQRTRLLSDDVAMVEVAADSRCCSWRGTAWTVRPSSFR